MANIKVNNLSALNITGAELFNDSESFLKELSDENEQIGGVGVKLPVCDEFRTYAVDPPKPAPILG